MLINKKSEIPIYYQIYTYYKDAILTNKLNAHYKLPSIRLFAKKHQISTTTVEKAYQQLLIEGYIESVPKSGFYTQTLPTLKTQRTSIRSIPDPFKTYKNMNQSPDSIDIEPLRKLTQDTFVNQKDHLFESNHPQGEPTLREALLSHLHEERGINAELTQMTLAPGMQNLIIMLKKIFPKQTEVAYLSPGYKLAIDTFTFNDFKEQSYTSIDAIIQAKPKLIYLSPSNHYPTGEVISINDRLKLIEYARHHHAYIIEDDYNHIYRYNAYQIPSIHSIAKGKT